MGRTREPEPEMVETLAEFHERLGGIPMERILMKPPPGTATENDLERAWGRCKLTELIDGVLVEKPMGAPESLLAVNLIRHLGNFVEEHDLGLVYGADAPFRLASGRVRLPDVSFIAWRSWTEQLARLQIVPIAPDLAVEVISPSNSKREMDLKVTHLFAAGTRLIWIIHPKTMTAESLAAPDKITRIGKAGALDGGDVVPGFRLPLADLFAMRKPRKRPA